MANGVSIFQHVFLGAPALFSAGLTNFFKEIFGSGEGGSDGTELCDPYID
jgi:hypothetical protein